MAVKLPFLQVYSSKGKTYSYYRRDGQRVRIPGAPGSSAWLAEYQKIHEQFEERAETEKASNNLKQGSLAQIIRGYLESEEFTGLADKTKKDYLRYISILQDKYGALSVKTLKKKHVYAIRNKYKKTPRTGDYLLSVLKLVLAHAEEFLMEYGLDDNWESPAYRVKKLQKKKRNKKKPPGSHRPWEDKEIEMFRDTWCISTMERFAFELLLATGQRGGDGITMETEHVKNDAIFVCQNKTNARLWIPMTGRIKALIAFWQGRGHSSSHLLYNSKGKPFKEDHFRHFMRDAYNAAKLPKDVTTHGLRYTAATNLREAGCTWNEIQSITGHETMQMAKKYAEQREDAEEATKKREAAKKA